MIETILKYDGDCCYFNNIYSSDWDYDDDDGGGVTIHLCKRNGNHIDGYNLICFENDGSMDLYCGVGSEDIIIDGIDLNYAQLKIVGVDEL